MAISNSQLKAALKKNLGVISLAAQELGVTRQAVHGRVNRSPELQAWIADIEETMLDAAEAVIKEAVAKKDRQTTRWFLERKGRSRGWVTRSEVTGADGAPLPAAGPSVKIVLQYVEPKPVGETEDVI